MASTDQQKRPRKRGARRDPSGVATHLGAKQRLSALPGQAQTQGFNRAPPAVCEVQLTREVEIERLKEKIRSLREQREALIEENVSLNNICESMRQECINQGVEPRTFSTQWANTEVGKEMLERSARIAELHGLIKEKQNELSISEQK
jgi:predicted RNase H-like nuclease (RuvC/YqgF family)